MKNYSSLLNYLFAVISSLLMLGCVHDDNYNEPDSNYECRDFPNERINLTLAQVKALYQNGVYEFPVNGEYPNDPDHAKNIISGYVSSSDEEGNIYKTIYIQDDPANPTQGFTISVNMNNTYTHFPKGSKVYIVLDGLAIGQYGGVTQLGIKDASSTATQVSRIPESMVSNHIFKSCTTTASLTPKKLNIEEFASNENLIGALIELDNAEFDASALCTNYAPDGQTVNKTIVQYNANKAKKTALVRNSGYAKFYNEKLPSGNGTFVGILSKYNSDFQLYINSSSDLKMNNFPRLDGIASDPCNFNAQGLTAKTVGEIKSMLTTGTTAQISGDYYIKAQVTANDLKKNLSKFFYIEDATGGLKVNVDMSYMNQDERFTVGKNVIIKLNGLYVSNYNGEIQLGAISGGRIAATDVYKYFFDSKESVTAVNATERTISQLSQADVGKWIKIQNLQFVDGDLGKTFTDGTSTSNRTLEDCNGNTIVLRTNGNADFGTSSEPKRASSTELPEGKGDVYAILSYYNTGNPNTATYQLWITKLTDIQLNNARCDGTLPVKSEVVYKEGFDNLNNWTVVNLKGDEVWSTTSYGNPKPSAFFDGKRNENDDWLVSSPISLAGYSDAFFSFETDGRYSGNPLEVYVTDTYTGDVSTTKWTKYDKAIYDTDMSGYAGFIFSGILSLKDFAGKNIVIAFRYTSVKNASTSWELDNVTVRGIK
ncbi:DUF5689 domain-containing protein [Weeksellaceae bacterium A-14]|uniref:DUF5689 domain-containing protein n=1 Tax=Daejeonia sp. YH14 TaxID=3439042 RepID=UPI0031E4BAFA